MYIPEHFEIKDEREIYSFAKANAFGQLISNVNGRSFSTHIPFLFSDDHSKVYGHLAKQNPQCSSLSEQEVLITLEGPHEYISPSWYAAPGVPTWNYQAVHIYGHARLVSDEHEVKTIIDTLTQQYEARFDQPWLPEYGASMLKMILGFEITISEVQCKYKLSQNRSKQDQAQVIDALKELGADDLANAMNAVVER